MFTGHADSASSLAQRSSSRCSCSPRATGPSSGTGPTTPASTPSETTIGPANVSGLRLRWSQSVGTQASITRWRSPTACCMRSGTDKLYAFDANTGSARWSSQGIGVPRSGASVANGVVYVSARTTGSTRWTPQPERSSGHRPPEAALFPDGRERCGVRHHRRESGLDAFDATTGAKLWSSTAGGGRVDGRERCGVRQPCRTSSTRWTPRPERSSGPSVSSIGRSVPAVANGVVYVCSRRRAPCVECHNRRRALVSATMPVAAVAPAVANGVVFVGGDRARRVQRRDGSKALVVQPRFLLRRRRR